MLAKSKKHFGPRLEGSAHGDLTFPFDDDDHEISDHHGF
jgi:hypothetical protein